MDKKIKLTPEQKKEQKRVFGSWRSYCSNFYKEGVEKYFDDLISLKDLELIVKNHGTVSYNLQALIKKQEEDRKKQAYFAIINNDIPLAKRMFEEAQREVQTLEDRLLKIKSLPYYQISKSNKAAKDELELFEQMDDDIKNKDDEIKKIEKRLEKAKRTMEQLLPLQEVEKDKKPVGRPGEGKKKNPAKEKALQQEIDKAHEVLVIANKVSASLLQRKLGIGFTKAARLIDILIQQQKVTVDANGAKKLNQKASEQKALKNKNNQEDLEHETLEEQQDEAVENDLIDSQLED